MERRGFLTNEVDSASRVCVYHVAYSNTGIKGNVDSRKSTPVRDLA